MMSPEGPGALVWDAERLRVATDAAGCALWSWNVDTDDIALDEHARALWSVTKDEPVTFEVLSERIHPEDIDRVKVAFKATRPREGAYEIDFRVCQGEEVRWISARGQRGDTGMVDRIMFGVFLDVTERKQIEETREMLAGEMSHRVKNLFAIASALTAIAARSAATTTEMARDLTQRLNAMGRAHDLVRHVPGEAESKTALMGDLLAVLLAPYDGIAVGDRVHIAVPDIGVGETAVTTLALIIHELATNSIKYGALSVENGTVELTGDLAQGYVTMIWREQGGPPVTAPQAPLGYGSKLLSQSVTGQFGGSIAFDWSPEGAAVTMRMSKARLET